MRHFNLLSVPPVSSLRSRKNFWLKMKATPLISSTWASAVVFLLMKLAVMAIANFPLNSFLLKPGFKNKARRRTKEDARGKSLSVGFLQQTRPVSSRVQTKGNLASNHNYKLFILRLAALY